MRHPAGVQRAELLIERAILLAPDAVARTAALAVSEPEQRWMLTRPRAVRRTFVEQVLDRGDDEHTRQRWMLLQDEATCASFLAALEDAPREQAWLLRQPAAVRASYVREVLDGQPADAG